MITITLPEWFAFAINFAVWWMVGIQLAKLYGVWMHSRYIRTALEELSKKEKP